MNKEPTKELLNKRSFEERVFARFDAFDARFDTVDARFDTVDARFDTVDARLEKLEARSYDTKPIWQRALKAIMEMGLEMGEVKSKVGVIEGKVGVIESTVGVIEGKVQLLENEIGVMKTDYKGIRNELIDIRREVRNNLKDKLDLILKFLLEDRDDIRDAEGRIRELESKIA
jgi:chromosome segregation ATPase